MIEKTAKNKLIYIPDEWYTFVRWAKQNNPPYKVVEMNQDLVLDFKTWLHTKTWVKDSNSNKINWNKIREVNILANEPDKLLFKYDLSEELSLQLDNTKNIKITRGRKRVKQEITFQPLYREHLPDLKYKDLINLCETIIIPQKYHNFY